MTAEVNTRNGVFANEGWGGGVFNYNTAFGSVEPAPVHGNHHYGDMSNLNAPYDAVSLQGLSADQTAKLVGFQKANAGPLPMHAHGHPDANTLINMGQYDPTEHWPSAQQDFLAGGERPGTFFRDLGTVNTQVPQWAWFTLAGAFTLFAVMAYRTHQKGQRKKKKR